MTKKLVLVAEDYKFNHIVQVQKYILKEECSKILKDFFKYIRERNKNKNENK